MMGVLDAELAAAALAFWLAMFSAALWAWHRLASTGHQPGVPSPALHCRQEWSRRDETAADSRTGSRTNWVRPGDDVLSRQTFDLISIRNETHALGHG